MPNAKYNPYSREPRPGGLLRSKALIAEYCGCAEKTIDRWYKQEGFPLGQLPNKQWVTTVTLIDTWIRARGILWLKNRMKHRPKWAMKHCKLDSVLYEAMRNEEI